MYSEIQISLKTSDTYATDNNCNRNSIKCQFQNDPYDNTSTNSTDDSGNNYEASSTVF
jgi:hypothetical protein